jgi:hypothetical protein
MANPVLTDCPKGQWTKVAAGVIRGTMKRKGLLAKYFETYRLADDPAPTTFDEAMPVFVSTNTALIEAQVAIDVYIWCKVKAGKVRVAI